MEHKPKKIQPNHILWVVLLLAAGSLPWLASLGQPKGSPAIEKAGPEQPPPTASVSTSVSASTSAKPSAS